MQIEVAEQKILLLKDKLTAEEAKEKAWAKKVSAFDAISKVASFLSKPKDDDFEVTYSEHRYEPFWHVAAKARYVYTRSAIYQVPVAKKEVRTVTIHETKYDVADGQIKLPVIEHCLQEEKEENLTNGVSGKIDAGLKQYLEMTPYEVAGELKDEVAADSILVPPQARVSAIMRDALAKMIKGIQADTILEEQVEVTHVDLYYRPVYAYKFLWKSKQKEAILEVDGLTGECTAGSRIFKEYFGKVLERDFLFDVGADAVGMFVPGGSIAVKAAKKMMDARKN
ncbi:hypothetical protein HZC53_05565 [Candidatus Uhrbacteria bacterium]|nr:hypothetical protein [Candidatus Uhrbacteria bacterium]